MHSIQSIEEVALQNTWVTIGSFDGVHLGHQALIRSFVTEAHAAGCRAVVITFFPHPARVLRGMNGPYYLSTPEERAGLLEDLGVDEVLTLEFNRSLADTSAEKFVSQLTDRMGMQTLWVGFNFALGKGREGDIPALRRLGEVHNFQVRVYEPVEVRGEIVSSSLIRAMLTQGNVEKAAVALGRRYSVVGDVIHGDGRGRGIGIPTANLAVWPERLLPALGVYAGWVGLPNGERHPAAASIGVRPTFEPAISVPRLEAMLLDFDRDLYGQTLSFEFVKFLRGEERYDTVEKLLEQIRQDVQDTRGVLSHDPGSPDLSAGPQGTQP